MCARGHSLCRARAHGHLDRCTTCHAMHVMYSGGHHHFHRCCETASDSDHVLSWHPTMAQGSSARRQKGDTVIYCCCHSLSSSLTSLTSLSIWHCVSTHCIPHPAAYTTSHEFIKKALSATCTEHRGQLPCVRGPVSQGQLPCVRGSVSRGQLPCVRGPVSLCSCCCPLAAGALG